MALPLEAAALVIGIVAVGAGVIAIAAYRAMLRTGNRSIGFVVVAFALLSAKNFVKSINLVRGADETATVEFLFSLVDLTVVALIAWPLLSRRGT